MLIPMSCDYYALVGVTLLIDTVQRIQDRLNPDLEILGILPTRYDSRTLHANEVLEVRPKTPYLLGKGRGIIGEAETS